MSRKGKTPNYKGCSESEDQRPRKQRPKAKMQNLKTASKRKEITCFSFHSSLVAFLSKDMKDL